MPANYVLLEKVTLTQTTSFITISNIPQSGYTDLKLVASVRALRTGFPADDLVIQFNGVTSGYSGRRLYGLASSVSSDTQGDIRGFASDADQTANVFGSNEFYIPNYLSSNYKSVSIDMVTENNGTDAPLGIYAGLWSNTAAINSIKVFCNNSNMVANSTFYLYGLAAVGTTPEFAPFANGGDIVTNDGTYWIHTFLSSGTFTPAKELTCDYLVVAGGGGGASDSGGGGGAGGLRSTVTATGGGGSLETALSLTAGNYAVAVGAGGVGGTDTIRGTSGTNSVFSTITSTSGGGGGCNLGTPDLRPGLTGGSGGGSGAYSSGGSVAGGARTASPVQGNDGGSSASSSYPNRAGGGGGGAGAVGGNATITVAGNGGNGIAVSITGTSVTYAGGGGGSPANSSNTAGTGGTGGGGNGSNSTTGAAGTVNLGGGGGGGAYPALGGSGGSGIVIIRYPIAS